MWEEHKCDEYPFWTESGGDASTYQTQPFAQWFPLITNLFLSLSQVVLFSPMAWPEGCAGAPHNRSHSAGPTPGLPLEPTSWVVVGPSTVIVGLAVAAVTDRSSAGVSMDAITFIFVSLALSMRFFG